MSTVSIEIVLLSFTSIEHRFHLNAANNAHAVVLIVYK